jgi:hypothetical protein
MRWEGHLAHMIEERNMYKVLIGEPEGRRLIGRFTCRCGDNIEIDLK